MIVLITSVTVATFDQREGAQAGRELPDAASQEAHAAGLALTPTYADLCLRLDKGRWLQAIVVQRDRHGYEFHECYYGGNSESN